MQYDFNHGMPLASAPNISPTKNGPLSMDNGHYPLPLKDVDGLERMPRQLLIKGQHGTRRRQRLSPTVWSLILLLGDGVLLLSLLALIALLVSNFNAVPRSSLSVPRGWNLEFVWMVLIFVLWSVVAQMTRAQELTNASNCFKSPLYALCALVLMSIFWVILTYPFMSNDLAYVKLVLFFLVLAIPAFSIWRILLAEIMKLPRFRRQTVIVGVNAAGEVIAEQLRNVKHPSTTVLGYIGESNEERLELDGLPILGGRSALRYLAHNGMIDIIITALDYTANPELFKEVTKAAQLGIVVLPMAVVYENNSGKIPVEHVGDQWYVALSPGQSVSLFYLCWHTLMNIISVVCGLLVLCLALPLVALLIYLDSPGPIFYRQERVGLYGKRFCMYKFRSMRTDAESNEAVWATKSDPRITRIGRFLRATHLDELPQIFNILWGEMSLIGPRPERPEFASELDGIIPFYQYRLAVKPGITGWTQVNCLYGNSVNDSLARLQYDLYYIKHRSFMLDVFIIFKTVFEVISHRGLDVMSHPGVEHV